MDRKTDTCNGAPIRDESLAARPIKVRPMVNRRALARCAPEHARLPRVQVRVKVDDRDRPIRAVNRAQERQHDRVIPTERNHPRVVLPVLRDRHERRARERVVRQRGERRAVQQLAVSVLDLLDRIRVVVRRHRYIAAIDDPEPGQERIHLQRHVVATVQRQAARSRTYTGGSEARSGPVRCAGVLRRAVPLAVSDRARAQGEVVWLTKGAPRNAMSNGTSLSFVRHLIHGNFANVVIPEKIASAVTSTKVIVKHYACVHTPTERGLTDQSRHQDTPPGTGTGHSPRASGLYHGHHVPHRTSRGTARAAGEA